MPPLSLNYGGRKSFTIRSKSYKSDSQPIFCASLNQVLEVDLKSMSIKVEPRVTMEMLFQATLPYGLSVPVIPEVKSMTVGGALMGIAGESSSHRWGCFHEICTGCEILLGNGDLLHASPQENPEIFYGLAGSYGSLGVLVSVELKLIPVKPFVHLTYYSYSNPDAVIDALQAFYQSRNPPQFLEGFIFAKDLAVIAIGNDCTSEQISEKLPLLSLKRVSSKWYYQHVYDNLKISQTCEEVMPYSEYIFRHDQGAFWIGAYFLNPALMSAFISQGMLKLYSPKINYFNEHQIERYHNAMHPSTFGRTVMHPWMNCQKLQSMLHRAEKWIQNRFIIQDFCIPENNAKKFLQNAMEDTGLFPIWLCPIKSTTTPQIFAPHQVKDQSSTPYFINIGLYGLSAYSKPIDEMTKKLECLTKELCGRKVLYARSYYTPEEFWEIYSEKDYEMLRKLTNANGIWHQITDKVLTT
ncbi:MAG: FAD-binding oxidoreductase [Parachlamydiaceae bacterium]|nr:FAD-binding oxidoreductase [Parachlamydiaceae bacterium]